MDKEQGNLGDRLSGFGKDPGEHVWNSLEEKLSAAKRRRMPLWYYVLPAGFLLFSAGVWMSLNKEPAPELLVSQQQTQPALKKEENSPLPMSFAEKQIQQSLPENSGTVVPQHGAPDKRLQEDPAPGQEFADASEQRQAISSGKVQVKKTGKGKKFRPLIMAAAEKPDLPSQAGMESAAIFRKQASDKTEKNEEQAEDGESQQKRTDAKAQPASELSTGREENPVDRRISGIAATEAEQKMTQPESDNIPAKRDISSREPSPVVLSDSLKKPEPILASTIDSARLNTDTLIPETQSKWQKGASFSYRAPVAGTLSINQGEASQRISDPENGRFYARSMMEITFRMRKELMPWLAVHGNTGLYFQQDYFRFRRNASRDILASVQGNQILLTKPVDYQPGFAESMRFGMQAGIGFDLIPGRGLPFLRIQGGSYFSITEQSRYSWAGSVSVERSGFDFHDLYFQLSACREFIIAGRKFWLEPQFLYLPASAFRYREGISRQVNYAGIGLGYSW